MNEKSSVEMSSTDPVVLGVSMPLNMTKTKATELASAWKEALVALVGAARSKVMPEKTPEASTSQSTTPSSTISA
jgi:hypothetical protein